MPSSRRARKSSLAVQAAELSLAVPQVVAHRLTRMALAGPHLNARDRREFTGMVAEKQLAFAQSWFTIVTELGRMQQQFALSLLAGTAPLQALRRARADVTRAGSRALSPYHRKAVSNSKRLARTKLR